MTAEQAQPPDLNSEFRFRDGMGVRTHKLLETFIGALPLTPVTILHVNTNNMLHAAFIDPTEEHISVHRLSPLQPFASPASEELPTLVTALQAEGHRSTEGRMVLWGEDVYSLYEVTDPNAQDYAAREQKVTEAWIAEMAAARKERPGEGNIHFLQINEGVLVDYRKQRKRGVEHSMTLLRRTCGNPLDIFQERPELKGLELEEASHDDYKDLPRFSEILSKLSSDRDPTS